MAIPLAATTLSDNTKDPPAALITRKLRYPELVPAAAAEVGAVAAVLMGVPSVTMEFLTSEYFT
jgi:hypothetical protein